MASPLCLVITVFILTTHYKIMYILISDTNIVIGMSTYKEALLPDLKPGFRIVTEIQYNSLFNLIDKIADTVKKDKVQPKLDNENNNSSDAEDTVELNPEYVLEALADLQSQILDLEGGTTHEEIETVAN